MTSPECCNVRRLARNFTSKTPNHHPLLDPEFPNEDISLVPSALAPRGQLNWELPKKATANLHIMLKLSNNAEELLDEFHQTLPQIDEALNDWIEMKGASPTMIGEEQLRVRSFLEHPNVDEGHALKGKNDDYVFNMARNLDNPGRADVIYLTEGVEESDSVDNGHSSIADNIRGVDWLDFDGSYLHLQDVGDSIGPKTAVPEALHVSNADRTRRDSIPLNLRTTGWDCDQDLILTPTFYNPAASTDANNLRTQTGPFNRFWRQHAAPHERPGSLRYPSK